jgi:capsular polysaccharide biosynthesis protein
MILNRASWRDMRCVATLDEALRSVRATGNVCRVLLHEGCDVSLPSSMHTDGTEGPARELSKSFRRGNYWAAALDLVVIPNAIFLPSQSTVLLPGARLCEELVYGIYANVDPMIWKPEGQPREITDWYAAKIESAPVTPGVHALVHPRWHHIYTHWFTEGLAALCDDKNQFELADSICIPKGPVYQSESLAMTSWNTTKFKILDEAAYRFEIALLPTHLFARTWVHPAIIPGLSAFVDEVAKHLNVTTEPAGPPIYLSREDASARKMTNEHELVAGLEAIGYKKVVAGELTFAEQVKAFSRAPALISPHGSGLTNMLFLRRGGRTLELRPMYAGDRGLLWDRSYQVLAGLLGRPYGALIYENQPGDEKWEVDIPLTIEKAKWWADADV